MRRKRLLVATGAVVAAGAAAAVAVAIWTVHGGGTGAAGATVAQSLTVTPVTPSGAAASLYPGGPAGPASFTVANPNPFAVTVTSVAWGTPVSTNTTTCPTSNISVDANAPTTVSIPVPANGTSGVVQINGVLDLSHSAPDGCQGVVFNVPVTASGVQQ